MRILYKNLAEAAAIDGVVTHRNTPYQSMTSPQLADHFQWDFQATGSVFDLVQPTQITTFGVHRGTFSGNGTYRIQANDTDQWSSPAFETDLTMTETLFFAFFDQTYRYWRFTFTEPDTATPKTGYVFLGTYLQMPGIDPKAKLSYQSTSTKSFSVSGQVYGNQGYHYLTTEFSFPMIGDDYWTSNTGLTIAGRKQLVEMFNTVSNVKPVWLFVWENSLDVVPPVFSVVDNNALELSRTDQRGRFWSAKLKFREVY